LNITIVEADSLCLISPERWCGHYVCQSTMYMGLHRPAKLMAKYKRQKAGGQHRNQIFRKSPEGFKQVELRPPEDQIRELKIHSKSL